VAGMDVLQHGDIETDQPVGYAVLGRVAREG
jgi:hypothetical protein